MKKVVEVCFLPFIIYLIIGLRYTDVDLIQIIAISITFSFGIYMFWYIYYFRKNGLYAEAKVIKKTKASSSGDDNSLTYYFQFLVDNKIYEPKYSYNFGSKIGEMIDVIVIKREARILPIHVLYRFFFWGVSTITMSIVFYYIKIMNIDL